MDNNQSDEKYTKNDFISRETSYPASNEPFSEELFRQIYQYQVAKSRNWKDIVRSNIQCSQKTILKFLPILKWLPAYNKEDIPNDLIAGLTVAVMNIPQGMAYATLAGCPPIVGIYMAIFPIWIYIIMGTSKHVNMGTFAVVCMMVGKCVASFPDIPAIQVAIAVSFVVGIWQILLSILKLGSLSVLLSETMVSGFTTGAAIHVFTSQIKNLLGLKLPRRSGPMKIPLTYRDIIVNINLANTTDLLLSTCFICFLIIHNELFKPWIQKKSKRSLPVPVELLTIIAGTVISQQLNLHDNFKVQTVNDVPTGFPVPSIPSFELIPRLLDDGLIIAIVAISINISMATIFAKKHNYEIDGNQEILACGVGNVLGSFFSCMPISTSLSRSLIQEAVGGKTQLANVFSSLILILVLLFVGPFFEPLPYSVLSTIVVVSLKGMFLQFKDLIKITKQSYLDSFVWIATFSTVVCLDIDYGLGIGIVASLATMIIRSFRPKVLELGEITEKNVFVDMKTFKKAHALPNISIFQIIGTLHFANSEWVKRKIMSRMFDAINVPYLVDSVEKPKKKNFVVLQMVSVPNMDPSAIKMLFNLFSDLQKYKVDLVLSECTPPVYDILIQSNNFSSYPKKLIFPFLPDALEYLRKKE